MTSPLLPRSHLSSTSCGRSCVYKCCSQAASRLSSYIHGNLEIRQQRIFPKDNPFPVSTTSLCLQPTAPSTCHRVLPPHCPLPLPPAFGLHPLPLPGLPWPSGDGVYHPVTHRIPVAHTREFGVYGIVAPEEVPSPPESVVPDMPTSPLLCMRSPGAERPFGLHDANKGVDVNNNDREGSRRQGYKSPCGGEALDTSLCTEQNFKALLEVGCSLPQLK